MKIHILTGVFYPEIHPRAFRAFELAKCFAKDGHQVTVSCLTRVKGFDYSVLGKELNISIDILDFYSANNGSSIQSSFTSKNKTAQFFYKLFRFCVDYFLSGNLFNYAIRIANKLHLDDDTDLFIASSTPFMDILAGAIFHHAHPNQHIVYVADSGDPFSGSKQTKRAFYFRGIEKWAYKQYNFLSIPTELAKSAYAGLLPEDKIAIIPQGFDFDATPLAEYHKNDIPTFAFAGVFYRDIRNPEFLLDFLSHEKRPFRFIMFLRHQDPLVERILDNYRDSVHSLEIHYGVNRTDLIYQLSKCDFLINIGNRTATQLPSKLIDYGITKRPIFHATSKAFDQELFEHFFNADFSEFKPIDIHPFDIHVITTQFIQLTQI